jgi:exosortase A
MHAARNAFKYDWDDAMTDILGGVSLFAQVRRDAVWQPIVASIAVVVSLISLGAMFPAVALGAFRVWVASPTFNHCFLVIPISLFMIWQRRRTLVGVPVVPDMRAPFVMIAIAFVWLVVTVTGVLEAEQFVVLSMAQVMLFGVLGPAFYRALSAPFLYLYFLVPSGAFLIPVLQAFTARFAVVGLHVLGIPVFSNGAVIEIPAGTFVVAEACAGLRFLIAAVAFGTFYAVFTYRSPLRRAAFTALSIVVPIIANGFRALGLIAVAQWIGNPQSALADHILYGWVFFSAVLLILILVGNFFSDRREDVDPVPLTPRQATAPRPFQSHA